MLNNKSHNFLNRVFFFSHFSMSLSLLALRGREAPFVLLTLRVSIPGEQGEYSALGSTGPCHENVARARYDS